MARYYDINKLKQMVEAKADTLIEGKEAFLCVAKWLDLLPGIDVAPKSEVERLEHLGAELSKEVADLQDALKCEKETNAHLCEEYMSAMREVEAMQRSFGEKLEVAEALIATLNKTTNNARQEVARGIFGEIKKAIKEEALDYCNCFEKAEFPESREYYKTKQDTAMFLYMKIDHLEKKYAEGKE